MPTGGGAVEPGGGTGSEPQPSASFFSYRQLLDGVTQVAEDPSTGNVYVVNPQGEVSAAIGGTWVDWGQTTSQMIVADRGYCYVLQADGVWRRGLVGDWALIPGSRGATKMVTAGGQLFVLKQAGQVFVLSSGRWKRLDDHGEAAVAMVGDRPGNLFVLYGSGAIWRYRLDGSWSQLSGTQTGIAMIAAAEGAVFMLQTSGNVWRRNGDADWDQVSTGTDTKQIAADGGHLYAVTANGNIYMWTSEVAQAGDAWQLVSEGDQTRWIEAANGRLYIIRDAGDLWLGEPTQAESAGAQAAAG